MSIDDRKLDDIVIRQCLRRLNLDRPDIAELPSGNSVVCNVTDLRYLRDAMQRFQTASQECIRLYEFLNKSVSVSLEKCRAAGADTYCAATVNQVHLITKAVLDSAKSQGARFEYVD